jgi:hypothetical protein
MLVRTTPARRMFCFGQGQRENPDIAWHALSFWWFCQWTGEDRIRSSPISRNTFPPCDT